MFLDVLFFLRLPCAVFVVYRVVLDSYEFHDIVDCVDLHLCLFESL